MDETRNKAAVTRAEIIEKRKAKEAERLHILRLMKECLVELLEEGQLSGPAKFAAVQLLNEVRHELNIDHTF